MARGGLVGANCSYNIYNPTTMTQEVDDRECLLALPLQERTVALALKHIFDSIRQIEDQQNAEVQKVHLSFNNSFRELERKASQIINGKPIPNDLIKSSEKFFTESQRKQAESLASNNKGLPGYWLVVLLHFYSDGLTLADKEIGAAITDITTNVSVESLEITIHLGKNEWIGNSSVTKRFVIENGDVARVEGDTTNWLKPRPEGLLPTLLLEHEAESKFLPNSFAVAGDFINEMVPYSIEYFLGARDDGEDEGAELEEEEGEEDEEEQEEEEAPAKKRKQ